MASHAVDLGGTTVSQTTIATGGGGLGVMSGQIGLASGLAYAASGGAVGQIVDLKDADSYCNLHVAGQALQTSGQLRIAVQTSEDTTSGNYTDPTSGLTTFPGFFSSGGILFLNSGGAGSGVLDGGVSGEAMQSGFSVFAAFLREKRYVRAVMLSGDFYMGPLHVTFVSQKRYTSSGGGQTQAPGSGAVNV